MLDDLNPRDTLTEAALAATIWDVLGGIGGLASGLSLLILLYLQTKPRVNRWSVLRFLHAAYAIELSDIMSNEQARRLRLTRRLRRWSRARCFVWYQRLMTMAQRVKAVQLQEAFESARSKMVGTWAPDDVEFSEHLTEDERGIVLEAAAVSRMREERQWHRRVRRIHKGVRCAGGCGTRFGKRRHDHDFSGGGGIEGGWHCESSRSCLDKPIGDHYCGMCTMERRSEAAAADGAAL